MTEEEYRAEMAKQARIANLIALRRLASDNAAVNTMVRLHGGGTDNLTTLIQRELGLLA